MKRRSFFKTSAGTLGAAGLVSMNSEAAITYNENGKRVTDKWTQVGTGKTGLPKRKEMLNYEVAVLGAGMSGIAAAVASARSGAKTVLVQDRPVLGGNASSEMRVTVNGVHGLRVKDKKQPRVERETGIIEEIMIENWHYNPQESYPVWDHVLYNYCVREPNLTVMLNTQATEAIMDGNRIKSAVCWGYTNETEYTISAKQFIDCSGDGLLAATAGAEYRTGREGKAEFNESYAPEKPDGWTQGDTIMMITKDMGRPVPFFAPEYAVKIDYEKAFSDKHRKIKQVKEGFWWVELGDDFDTIGARERNRHNLMAYLYGLWDHIKNSGDFPEAENMVLDWVGSIPGRRESRRFMGDHILSQTDLTEFRHFEDAVAYGGWSLDEHCPGGIENLDDPASYFHQGFHKLYEIPYRSLYSRNIANLQFAGRNASLTHVALSSTRIISTCAMMGQATGTAAAMCCDKGINPRDIARQHIEELQETIIRDDVFIPNRPAGDAKDLVRNGGQLFGSPAKSGDTALLTDGIGRDIYGEMHHWESSSLPAELQVLWEKPVEISRVELKADTELHKKIAMHKNPAKNEGQHTSVPPELIKTMTVEAQVKGKWVEVAKVENNLVRRIKTSFPKVKATAIRLNIQETWGKPTAKVFEVRAYTS
ncbi:FAD-dependent oxidoreductase [Pontiellaceae bacterium B12227]|nr:FAD-dependent oxidoreductase [Pontiellaceae bacterium B12227]